MNDPIIAEIVQELAESDAGLAKDFVNRSEVGIARYGTTLARTDLGLKAWLKHLREELMDASAYAKRLEQEVEAIDLFKQDMRLASIKLKGGDLQAEQARLAKQLLCRLVT